MYVPLPAPFPHGTSTLSVTGSYLGLEGGPPGFPQGFSCLVVLWILLLPSSFAYGAFTLFGGAFPDSLLLDSGSRVESTTPENRSLPVWPVPISLATTFGISFDFSS